MSAEERARRGVGHSVILAWQALGASAQGHDRDCCRHHLYVDPRHWFTGGQSLAAQGANSFWLDIKVVDGSNTKDELADYLEAVFSAMGTLLGGVHAESYVHIHEVSAAAYGFGGITQEYRYIKGRLDAA